MVPHHGSDNDNGYWWLFRILEYPNKNTKYIISSDAGTMFHHPRANTIANICRQYFPYMTSPYTFAEPQGTRNPMIPFGWDDNVLDIGRHGYRRVYMFCTTEIYQTVSFKEGKRMIITSFSKNPTERATVRYKELEPDKQNTWF